MNAASGVTVRVRIDSGPSRRDRVLMPAEGARLSKHVIDLPAELVERYQAAQCEMWHMEHTLAVALHEIPAPPEAA